MDWGILVPKFKTLLFYILLLVRVGVYCEMTLGKAVYLRFDVGSFAFYSIPFISFSWSGLGLLVKMKMTPLLGYPTRVSFSFFSNPTRVSFSFFIEKENDTLVGLPQQGCHFLFQWKMKMTPLLGYPNKDVIFIFTNRFHPDQEKDIKWAPFDESWQLLNICNILLQPLTILGNRLFYLLLWPGNTC